MQKLIAALSLLCTLATIGAVYAQQNAKSQGKAQPAAQADTQLLLAKTYAVADLAVWSEKGQKFDPSILIALLKSKVPSSQWTDESAITPFTERSALVVSATQAAHESIAHELASLRKP